jgi:ParB/RepB/Spo0J family partition protein
MSKAKDDAEKVGNGMDVTNRGIEVSMSVIKPKVGFNVREDANPDEELLALIKEHGVLRPLHIRNDPDNDGFYLIVDGERRYNAAKKLGLETVPCIPEGEMNDDDALVVSVVANGGHKDLSSRETANAFKRLREAGVDEEEIARVMGCKVRKVKETLRALEKGVDEIKEGVKADAPEERIPPRAAARAADLPEDIQKEVAKKIRGKNVTEGLEEVRKEEKKLGIKKRGRKTSEYHLAPGTKKLCQLLETVATATLKQKPGDKRSNAHLEVIYVLKGDLDIIELYPKAEITIQEGSQKGLKKKMTTEKTAGKKTAKAKKAGKTKTKKATKAKKVVKSKAGKKAAARRPAR